jgi:hypothetical protein
MTRRTNARIAGFAFLLYIAAGIPAMILHAKATHGADMAAKLATIAQHAQDMRIAALLVLCGAFSALALGVTLYAITRDEDRDLAMLGLACRVAEGIVGALSTQNTTGLLWLASASGADAPDPQSAQALAAFLLNGQGSAAMFFGVGSLLFSWLLLRGRMIPSALAWIGLIASIIWVVGEPLRYAQVVPGSLTWFIWAPMAAFEIPFALWLIFKGAAVPTRTQPA